MTVAAAPSSDAPRRRRPWLGALMSLVWPGVGQLYNGEARKTLTLLGVWVVLTAAVVALTYIAPPAPASFVTLLVLLLMTIGLAIYAAVDAFRAARRVPMRVLKRYQCVWVYVPAIVLMIAVSRGAAQLTAWRSFSVPTASMVPTVLPGDYLTVQRYPRAEAPQRGDLVIFRSRGVDYIKRVVGMPGDRVQLRAGVVYLNGVKLEQEDVGAWSPAALGLLPGRYWIEIELEPGELYRETLPDGRHYWIMRSQTHFLADTAEVVVPTGHYFMLGDRRDSSFDSRDHGMGFVARDDIQSRAYLVWWSRTKSRIGTALE